MLFLRLGKPSFKKENLFSKTNYFEATLEPKLLNRAIGGNQTIYLSNGVVGL